MNGRWIQYAYRDYFQLHRQLTSQNLADILLVLIVRLLGEQVVVTMSCISDRYTLADPCSMTQAHQSMPRLLQ